AGEFYEKPERYEALAREAGGVRILNRYIADDEVEALFRAADVTVLPYRAGTQSGVTHVAYALGSPVIATRVGGLGETVVEGATLRGPDGRSYSKNTAGEAVLALPLVVAGDAAARAAGFRDERAELAARFVASFFNAVVAALIVAALALAFRELRVSARAAF